MEGRVLPVGGGQKKASLERPVGATNGSELAFAEAAINHAFKVSHRPE